MNYRIDIEIHSSHEDIQTLVNGLIEHNLQQTTAAKENGGINIIVRDDSNTVIGGLKSFYYLKTLFIDYLYLDDSLRGTGLGKKLLEMAETEAKKHNCNLANLKTFSFQAPEFYKKHGYSVFAELNLPTGDKMIYLQKTL